MIGAMVLAAGRSARMGAQKLLLPLAGKPAITHIVDEMLRGPLQPVIVVVRRADARIAQALLGRAVAFVHNPDAEGDMLSSVRCGLRALPAACEAILVALGDQPGISHKVVAQLTDAFRQSGRAIIVPTYRGKRGHPLLFAACYRDEVLTRYDGVGLRGLLDSHPDEVLEIEVPVARVLEDLDTPEDYQRYLESTAAGGFP